MREANIVYRPMNELREFEKEYLHSLTIDPSPSKRSLFRYWLDHFSHLDLLHTALVMRNGKIIGWSAANMSESWNRGMIDAFVASEFRGRGYARRAVSTLISVITPLYKDWPQYLVYEKGKERFFRPSIECSIFKDWYLYREEYEIKQREMCAG